MNERIKQLEKQAWDYAYDHETVKGKVANDGFINMNFSDAFSQKFAELIVLECANHCDLLLDHKISSEWSRGTHDCSRAIKKHFGVEEWKESLNGWSKK